MQIYLDSTPHSTMRLWLFGLAPLSPEQVSAINPLRSVLDSVSCWGGCDKSEVDKNNALDVLSWELPAGVADHVFAVAKELLERLGFAFTVGFPK